MNDDAKKPLVYDRSKRLCLFVAFHFVFLWCFTLRFCGISDRRYTLEELEGLEHLEGSERLVLRGTEPRLSGRAERVCDPLTSNPNL